MATDSRKPTKPDARTQQESAKTTPQGEGHNEGEGNKSADKQYRDATRRFVRSGGSVVEHAEEASEALEGPERAELEDAERMGREKARR